MSVQLGEGTVVGKIKEDTEEGNEGETGTTTFNMNLYQVVNTDVIVNTVTEDNTSSTNPTGTNGRIKVSSGTKEIEIEIPSNSNATETFPESEIMNPFNVPIFNKTPTIQVTGLQNGVIVDTYGNKVYKPAKPEIDSEGIEPTEITFTEMPLVTTDEAYENNGDYVKITFLSEDHGEISSPSVYYVYKKVPLGENLAEPIITAHEGYTYEGWDDPIQSSYSEPKTHTATYSDQLTLSATPETQTVLEEKPISEITAEVNKDAAVITVDKDLTVEGKKINGTAPAVAWADKDHEEEDVTVTITATLGEETKTTTVTVKVQRDTDGDGIPDVTDTDHDNDGIQDTEDENPKDKDSTDITISVDGNNNIIEGKKISPIIITAKNQDGNDVSVEVSGLPDGLSFNPSTGQIEGTPNRLTDWGIREESRSFTVTITATDDTTGSTVTKTFTINVLRDTDGDGNPDITDPDDDNDGYTDDEEKAAGTNPKDPNRKPSKYEPGPSVIIGGLWNYGSTTTVEQHLERGKHFAYISGYEDGTVRPNGNVTRAEAVTMIVRLKGFNVDDIVAPNFSDVTGDNWFNRYLKAAFKAGILEEKEGENFRPNEPITRAELAQMISYIDKVNDSTHPFDDSKGHKFEKAISQSFGNKRIIGYEDGTFRPDNSITRAETATILNSLFERKSDDDFYKGFASKISVFPDIDRSHWAYYEIIEASNSHEYQRREKNNLVENWLEVFGR